MSPLFFTGFFHGLEHVSHVSQRSFSFLKGARALSPGLFV
jgi:hypothetical protein